MPQRDHFDDAAVDGAAHPAPFHRRELLDREQVDAFVLGGLEDRLGERMLGTLLHRRGPLQHVRRGDRRAVGLLRRDDVRDRGLPFRDGAGLVEQHGAHAAEFLQRFPSPHQDSLFGGPPRRDQNRGRGGEAQRAGTGDDQDGDQRHRRIEHRGRGAEIEPGDESAQRDRDHDRHEHAGDPIGEPLDRGLGRLGVLDHAEDLAEGRVLPHSGRAEGDAARRIDRAADDFVSGLLGDRQRLARQHRLIDRGCALGHETIDRDGFPRLHDDTVPGHDGLDVHVGLDAVFDHVSDGRPEPGETADRFRRPALGARLQQPPEQNQGDDRGDGLVIDVGGEPRIGE